MLACFNRSLKRPISPHRSEVIKWRPYCSYRDVNFESCLISFVLSLAVLFYGQSNCRSLIISVNKECRLLLWKNEHTIITITLHVVLCKTGRLDCLRETTMSVTSRRDDKGGKNASQI